MKCYLCRKKFKKLDAIYHLRTMRISPYILGQGIIFVDVCKDCAPYIMQVDENCNELKRGDKELMTFDS